MGSKVNAYLQGDKPYRAVKNYTGDPGQILQCLCSDEEGLVDICEDL